MNEMEGHILQGLARNPVELFGRAEDIADIVTFLCSIYAGFINGTNVCV